MDNNTLLLLGAVVAVIVLPRVIRAIKQISPQKAKELVASGATIVDVRQSGEYRSNHIKNAINIPLDTISQIGKKVSKDKDIIVYCQSGARSSSAAKQLKAMGYNKVHDLGSINRW